MITQDQCIDYLSRLGFTFIDKNDDRVLFEIPSWRQDIEREVDLIEEVARIHGFEKIPYSLPMMEIGPNHEHSFIEFSDDTKESLASQGFTEIISFPFVSTKDLDHLRMATNHPFREMVELENPLVEEQRFLQPTLAINLLRSVGYNRRHGLKGVRVFEAARTFHSISGDIPDSYGYFSEYKSQGAHITQRAEKENRPFEKNIVAAIMDQPYVDKTWQGDKRKAGFFDMKQSVIQYLNSFGYGDVEFVQADSDQLPWLTPGAAAGIFKGKDYLGYIGELHPEVAKNFDLDFMSPPVLFEINLDKLYSGFQKNQSYETLVHKFPAVTRDLAFIVDKGTTHHDFSKAIKGFNRKKFLRSFSLFDVYEGANVAEDKKSMAYSFSFQSPKKTLTEKEVEKEINGLMKWLNEQLSAELR